MAIWAQRKGDSAQGPQVFTGHLFQRADWSMLCNYHVEKQVKNYYWHLLTLD